VEEVWKDIDGYEGFYEISNYGRVKSLPKWMGSYFSKEKILTPKIDKNNYEYYGLVKPTEKRKYLRTNRMVAKAFIENHNNLPQVNHKDGNKRNNYYENLEWSTPKENIDHAWRNGLKEKAREAASLVHGQKCKLVSLVTEEEVSFNSKQKLSLFLGYNSHWLSSAIQNGTNYEKACLNKGYKLILEG